MNRKYIVNGVSYEIEPLETREQDKNYKTYYY